MDNNKVVTRNSKKKNEKKREKNEYEKLENWTLLADCNWGEKEKSNIVTVKNLNLILNNNGSDSIQMLHIFDFWSSLYTYRLINSNKKDTSMDIKDISTPKKENKMNILNLYDDIELESIVPHCAKIYAFRLYSPPLFDSSHRYFL
jgi:hypothetical protein